MTAAYAIPPRVMAEMTVPNQSSTPLEEQWSYGQPVQPIFGVGDDANLLRQTFERMVLAEPLSPFEAPPWQAFVAGLDDLGLPSQQQLAFKRLWTQLLTEVGDVLPLPAVEQTEEGLKTCWSTPSYYAEVEISPAGRFQWFFRDRIKDRHVGSDDEQDELPPAFASELKAVLGED
jgi:hypothetical protein